MMMDPVEMRDEQGGEGEGGVVVVGRPQGGLEAAQRGEDELGGQQAALQRVEQRLVHRHGVLWGDEVGAQRREEQRAQGQRQRGRRRGDDGKSVHVIGQRR